MAVRLLTWESLEMGVIRRTGCFEPESELAEGEESLDPASLFRAVGLSVEGDGHFVDTGR